MSEKIGENVEIAVQPYLKDRTTGQRIPIESANFCMTRDGGVVVVAGSHTFFFDVGSFPKYIIVGKTEDGSVRHSFLNLLPTSVWPSDEVIYFVNGGLPEGTDGEG